MSELDGSLFTYFDTNRSIKQAASSTFTAEMMKKYVPDDRHFAVHLIGLGASENYGANKNGDWWNEPSLKHDRDNYGTHTFVKNGHYFREHRNRDPKKKIGDIRAAAFNPEMHRSELVIWGDKRKAEKEYQDAKAGKALDFSMSAKVKGDICSCCGNFAKRSSQYCDHAKNHMTQWMTKYSKFVYVDNVEPNFFDISSVENRADRIARHLEVLFAPGDGVKSASVNGFLFSDLQADREGICLPDSFQTGCFDDGQQRWLVKLADTETYIENVHNGNAPVDARLQFVKQAAQFAFSDDADDAVIEAMRRVDPSVLFGYLAKQAAVIPFKTFFTYSTNMTTKAAAEDPAYRHATALLPGAFRDVLKSPADEQMEQMFVPASATKMAAADISYDDQKILKKFARDNSLLPELVRERILTLCGNSSESVKQAAVDCSPDQVAKAKVVAKAYAMYKLAFVDAVAANLGQENVDDSTLILLTSTHND